jgi:hypothetical protein
MKNCFFRKRPRGAKSARLAFWLPGAQQPPASLLLLSPRARPSGAAAQLLRVPPQSQPTYPFALCFRRLLLSVQKHAELVTLNQNRIFQLIPSYKRGPRPQPNPSKPPLSLASAATSETLDLVPPGCSEFLNREAHRRPPRLPSKQTSSLIYLRPSQGPGRIPGGPLYALVPGARAEELHRRVELPHKVRPPRSCRFLKFSVPEPRFLHCLECSSSPSTATPRENHHRHP